MNGRKLAFLLAALALLGLLATNTYAQSDMSTDELAAKATDPTAALMSFQFNDWYTPSFHDLDGSSNQLVFRSAIPFEWGSTQHIFRITAPWVTSSPSGANGLGDTTIFDLVTFNATWGRWGVGLAGSIPTGSTGVSLEKWTAGPALGFVNSSNKKYHWGLFTQTFFSFSGDSDAADVGIINLQPIFSYQLGKGRSISLGNSAFIYDTENSRWSSKMLGLNYGQVISLGKHKWRPNIEVDYGFQDDTGNPEWVIRLGMILLLPKTK